jgi:hypothetical protein
VGVATATETLTQPVDTTADDTDHIACPHRDITWCGQAGEGPWLEGPYNLDDMCRVCILAYEMLAPGEPCPVCGCHACLLE